MIRQIKSGEEYKKYKKINQINLNNYDLFQEGKFLYRSFVMEEKSHQKRDNLLEIIDINLDFLSKVDYTKIKKLNAYDLKWLLYIFVCPDDEERKELYKGNQIMKKVYNLMDNFTEELNAMLYYNPEEFRKMCEFNQGKREGKEERNMEIAKNLIEMGVLSYDQISKVTNLSLKELKEIQRTK